MKKIVISIMLILIGALSSAGSARMDLSGEWRFSTDPKDVGQGMGWQGEKFDDSAWRLMKVPGNWEKYGMNEVNQDWMDKPLDNYSGCAWYRRTVNIPAEWKDKNIYLNLGRINDVDWTYFNGRYLGSCSGSIIGPESAKWIPRSYQIPKEWIRYGGENTIAVKVLDFAGGGGIERGPVSLTLDKGESLPLSPGPFDQDSDDLIRFFGNTEISSDHTVNDLVMLMGNADIDGNVSGDAVSVVGNIDVRGYVAGDVVSVCGNITVYPGGRIDGDVTAVAGNVRLIDDAYVGGEITTVCGGLIKSAKSHAGSGKTMIGFPLPDWLFGMGIWGILLFSAIFSLVSILICAVMAALFPDRARIVADVIERRPGYSLLNGIALSYLWPIAAIILVFTCVGIIVIPFAAIYVFIVDLFGRTGVGLLVGSRILKRPSGSIPLSTALGVLVIGLVGLIPVLGWLAVTVVNCAGTGAALTTGLGASDHWLRDKFGGSKKP